MKNPRIGSIERVGEGYIVCSHDSAHEDFFDGKRLFHSFDSLVEFLNNQIGTVGRSMPSLSGIAARKGNGVHEYPATSDEVRGEVSHLLGTQEDPQQLLLLQEPTKFHPLQEVFESREPVSLSL